MPVTTLDPKTALIVVDLQKGIAAIPTSPPVADIVPKAVALLHAFRRQGLPVVLVNVTGRPPGRTQQSSPAMVFPPDFAELLPELEAQPSDHLLTKRTRSAFVNSDLDAYLRAQAVTQVVVVGVATSAGVESTARQAHEHGFHVTLAIDAMTDRSPEAHAHSLTHIFPRIGETGTTAEILALLEKTQG